MHSLPELSAAITALVGARFVEVRRTLDMVEVGFLRDEREVRLHVQCPFRIVQGETILLGSADHRYPRGNLDRHLAFDRYETQFDHRAKVLSELLGEGQPVTEAHLRPDGAFHLSTAEQLRIEAFPAVSGRVECWRLFVKGSDEHYVYPPGRTP